MEFIKKLSSKDLHFLVKILDEPNTSFLSKDKKFKENFPLHNKYFEPIGEELQHFGGNTIANIARLNKGVGYKEILLDVNKKITNKECDKSEKIEDIEMGILKHLFDCLDNNALYELISNINDKDINKNSIKEILDNKNDKNYLKVLDKLVKFLITNVSILNYSASTLKDNGKTLFLGLINIPASVVATSLKTLSDPAFRVTIPAVLEIARLRMNYLFGDKNEIEKYEISVVSDKNEILNNLDKFSVVEIKENLDDDIGFGDTLVKTGIETGKNVDLLNKANELLKTNVPIEKLSLDKSGKMLGQ